MLCSLSHLSHSWASRCFENSTSNRSRMFVLTAGTYRAPCRRVCFGTVVFMIDTLKDLSKVRPEIAIPHAPERPIRGWVFQNANIYHPTKRRPYRSRICAHTRQRVQASRRYQTKGLSSFDEPCQFLKQPDLRRQPNKKEAACVSNQE